ncbi:tRNA methyltransferase complex GCD14 subunit-domain-containing protein [Scenedesmus sp. NREL 46B-D3]|nr:tRNA methyltransferase complex GCD14 subunit-domain-containing protein [Scenedesmus sp. NREL 46B-D3]
MVLPQAVTGPGPRLIQEGDLVVVYESYNALKAVYVDKKGQCANRFGNFQHKDWVGQPYGSRVHCRPPGRGWVYLLAPTAELWTQVLRHRTQILYVADISLVVANLALMPGKTVLESGTGSGSLTHSLARAVAPHGHVHTFDFHQLRADEARVEFDRHGLSGLVTGGHRNIEEQGFPQELHGTADAVFLDLPGPWKVVPSAAACIKPGGNFCSFSPCIEQVQRTCEALDRHGFTDVRTLEVLLRTYEVTTETLHTNAALVQQPNKQGKKRSRGAAAATDEAAVAAEGAAAEGSEAAAAEDPAAAAAAAAAADPGFVRQVLAKPSMDARGHTGYLTFARRFVAAVALDSNSGGSSDAEQEEAGEDKQDAEAATAAAASCGEEQRQQTDSTYESGAAS